MKEYKRTVTRRREGRVLRVIVSVLLVLTFTVPLLASQSPKVISFACMNDPFAEPLEQLLPLFKQETGIDVKMDILPYTGLREKMLMDLIGKSGQYDVITMDICWMGEWAEAGFVEPLEPLITRDNVDLSDMLPGAMEGLAYWKGKIYGMPIGAYYFLMYYRKDLLEQEGIRVPETINEFLQVAKRFTLPEQDFYGVSFPVMRGSPITHYFLAYLAAMGGGVFKPGTYEPNLFSETGIKALTAYKTMMDYAPPGIASYDWNDTPEAFKQNRVALSGLWSADGPNFEDPNQSLAAGKTGYAYLPVLKKGDKPIVPFGGWSLVINKSSRNKEASWEFIKWVTSEQVQKLYAELLGTPVRISTLSDKELQQKFPWYKVILEAELAGCVDADFRPRIPEWPQMEEVYGLHLNRAMIGEESIEDALQTIDLQVTDILKKSGRLR